MSDFWDFLIALPDSGFTEMISIFFGGMAVGLLLFLFGRKYGIYKSRKEEKENDN